MDFPPLDDTRWDRLLGAVVGQCGAVSDPDDPRGTSFPVHPASGEDASIDHEVARRSIDLDAYA